MRPYIGAVIVHKDSHIADKANVPRGTVGAQCPPLLIEGELDRLLDFQLTAILLLEETQGVALPVSELRRPRMPGRGLEFLPQYAVGGVIVQPKGILFTKQLKTSPLLRVVAAEEITRGFFQERLLRALDFIKTDLPLPAGQPCKAFPWNPICSYQLFQTDQQGVTGKGRERGIGGIAEARGTQRQHLPKTLF